jgi:molybdate transport system substrate-binding protein
MHRSSILRLGVLACVALVVALALVPGRQHDDAHPRGSASTLRIAAASAMRPAMDELLAGFHREHAHIEVVVSFGASGNLYAQVASGAPFDLFLASDRDYPEAIVRNQLAAGDAVPYATGRLVLWARHDSPVDLQRGISALEDPRLRRLALATPRHAPYGRAALNLLEQLGLDEPLAGKLILGENVEQAAKFAQTGAADAALIPQSLAQLPAMQASGRSIAIAPELCPGIQHAAVITRRAARSASAQDFLDYLLSSTAQDILRAHGLAALSAHAEGP